VAETEQQIGDELSNEKQLRAYPKTWFRYRLRPLNRRFSDRLLISMCQDALLVCGIRSEMD